MYEPPAYLSAMIIGGIAAIAAATCVALYGGAVRAGGGRRRAALFAGSAAVLLGGWLGASAVIAGHGWYDTRVNRVPWLAVAAVAFLAALLALRRIPVVARTLATAGMVRRLLLPHSFRVVGVFFLVYLALGHLPALFALPAGLGDITAGIAAPFVARGLGQGTGRRAAWWFNAYGVTDLVVASTLVPSRDTSCSTSPPRAPRSVNSRSRWSRRLPCRCCLPCTSRPCPCSAAPPGPRGPPPRSTTRLEIECGAAVQAG